MLITLSIIILIIIDQLTKYLSVHFLKPMGTIEIIKNIFSLTYVENPGAAFGILSNSRWLFIGVTILIIVGLTIYTLKKKIDNKLYLTSYTLIVSGGIANLIDRIFNGYVVDMLEITFIDYPVFNFADCLVVIGAILLCIYTLKYDFKSEGEDNNG